MTKKTGERVGGAFGHAKEVDVPENEVGWGPYLQVRISVDITKPIPRGRLVKGTPWFLSLNPSISLNNHTQSTHNLNNPIR